MVTQSAEISTKESDERYLPALALAMVDQPRANLQELAKAIGVSKATLYRFCRTREELTDRLVSYVGNFCNEALNLSRLNDDPSKVALRNLIDNHLTNKDLLLFLIYHWRPEYLDESHPDQVWVRGQATLDAFFLKGQQDGDFRLDISAATMTEFFYSLLAGLVDAELRGRVPRSGLADLVEKSVASCIYKT